MCRVITASCADTNINAGNIVRYSRTKDTALLSFVPFYCDCFGLLLFHACVLCVGAQKVFEPIQLDSRTGGKWKERLLF